MSLSRQADPLRVIAMRLEQKALREEVAFPGVNEALRVSIYYHDGRVPNSVATLKRSYQKSCQLTVVYDKHDREGKIYTYNFEVSSERYPKLLTAFRTSKFDSMDDDPNLPVFGVDLWLIERASGSFYHDVLLSPTHVGGHHRELVLALRHYLPEGVRELVV